MVKCLIKERTFIGDDGQVKTRFGYRGKNKIQWIVIHYAGSVGVCGKAKGLATRMQTWKECKSTHYIVGTDGVYQTLDEKYSAWHCGGYSKDNKCEACNAVSIGVDLMECKCDRGTCSASDKDWYFKPEVVEAGAVLVAELADKYEIPSNHIIRHFDITGKRCPRPFVGDDVSTYTGTTGNFEWIAFKLLIDSKRKVLK